MFQNVSTENLDAGESPKRRNTEYNKNCFVFFFVSLYTT